MFLLGIYECRRQQQVPQQASLAEERQIIECSGDCRGIGIEGRGALALRPRPCRDNRNRFTDHTLSGSRSRRIGILGECWNGRNSGLL